MHKGALKNNTKWFKTSLFFFICLWISYTIWAFWFYWLKPIQPFYVKQKNLSPKELVIFYQKELSEQIQAQQFLSKIPLLPTKKGYILYFVDRNCACNRYIQNFQERLQRFSKEFVPVFMYKGESTLSIPASPALAILDRQGHVHYFGPYALPEFCGASNTMTHWNIIQNKIKTINESFHPVQTPEIDMLVNGCFCQWEK